MYCCGVSLVTWLFLVMPPSIWWCCAKVHTHHILPWLTHGLNMAKRKQSFLLTNFGFTSEKLYQDNQNVKEEAGSATVANVHAGPSSD